MPVINIFGSLQRSPNRLSVTANFYEVIVPPNVLAVDLDTVKLYLRLDVADTGEDSILTLFVDTAVELFEKYTGRTLFQTTFRTFRDQFFSRQFVLIRAPLVTFLTFDYIKNGILTPVDPSIFYTTNEDPYSRIILKVDEVFPTDIDIEKQAIQITFIAGIADNSNVYPNDIKIGLLQLIAFLYENRGDCNLATLGVEKLPASSVAIFNKYRIFNIVSPNYQEAIENDMPF